MSDPGKAVFLSYASQDAEAARLICEALRAAGVEVWFDQSELVGGDAWDQKIRRQIKDCALLIPIISAATQARTEGYFRLEWRLADQRTHLMAKGRPFLLPVVIDDTRDSEAHVPDSFTEVQWTRLPGGESSATFAARVKKLLAGGTVAGVADPGLSAKAMATAEPASPRPATAKPSPRWLAPVIAGVVVALLALIFSRPWEKAPPASGLPPPASAVPAAPLSAARQLVAQARPLVYEFNVLRADYDTAASLLEQAAKFDPNDATVWAMWAVLDCRYIDESFDGTPARKAAAKAHVARAQGLDPGNRAVRFAQAYVIVRLGDYSPAVYAESEKLLRPLLAEDPHDPWVLRNLGFAANTQGRQEEALDWFERAAKQPGDAAESAYCRALVLLWSRRYEEAEQALEKSVASGHLWKALSYQVVLQSMWHGDLDQAQRTMAGLPLTWLMEDQGASTATYVYLWRGETDKALNALRQVPHDYLESQFYVGPKSAWMGDILAAGGRLDAARSEWRSALQMVEQRLAGLPNDWALLTWKIILLAKLGEGDEARRLLKIGQGLYGPDFHRDNFDIALLLGSPERAFATIEAVMAHPPWYWSAAALRFDPQYEPLRKDPRFAALLARAEADPNLSPQARAVAKKPATP